MADRAVVLVSGGLDSATCLAIARARGYDCFALSFDYGQRSVVSLLPRSAWSNRKGASSTGLSPGSRRAWRVGSYMTRIWWFPKTAPKASCYLCSSEKYRVSVLRFGLSLSHRRKCNLHWRQFSGLSRISWLSPSLHQCGPEYDGSGNQEDGRRFSHSFTCSTHREVKG